MAVKYCISGNFGVGPWSTTSGGAGDAGSVGSTDDLIVDSNSPSSITTYGNLAFNSLRFINYTGTFNQSTWFYNVNGADSGNRSFVLSSGMTYQGAGEVRFLNNTGGTFDIDPAGVTMPGYFTINGSSTYRLQGNLVSQHANGLVLTKGTLNLNGKTITVTKINASNSNTRSLVPNGATINLTSTLAETIFDFKESW